MGINNDNRFENLKLFVQIVMQPRYTFSRGPKIIKKKKK